MKRRSFRFVGAALVCGVVAIPTVPGVAVADNPPAGESHYGFTSIFDTWSSPTSQFDVPGLPTGAPKQLAVSHDGMHLAVIASNDLLYYAPLDNPSPSFQLFTAPSGASMPARDVAIDVDPVNGQVEIAVLHTNGRLFHTGKAAGGSWTPWGEPSPVGATYRAISMSVDAHHNAHFAALDAHSPSNAIYRIRYAPGNWSSWEPVRDVNANVQKGLDVAITVTRTVGDNRLFCDEFGTWQTRSVDRFAVVATLDTNRQLVSVGKQWGLPFRGAQSVHTNYQPWAAPPNLAEVAMTHTRPRSFAGSMIASSPTGTTYTYQMYDLVTGHNKTCGKVVTELHEWLGFGATAHQAGSAGLGAYTTGDGDPARFLTNR